MTDDRDEPYDPGELLVLQHHDVTGPDQLVPTLDGRAGTRPWRRVHLGEEPVPELTARTRGVLVLGGPMGVTDVDAFPWIDAERSLLASAVDRGVAVLGICLGAQLLATTLGGEVRRRTEPEVGLFRLDRTAEGRDDAVTAGWADGSVVLLSHQDEVSTLPPGAVPLLEGSDGVPAWRTADGLVHAVQFHPETGPDLLAGWTTHPDLRPVFTAAGVDPEAFVAEVRAAAPFLRAAGVSLVGRWLDGVVGRDDPAPRKRRRAA